MNFTKIHRARAELLHMDRPMCRYDEANSKSLYATWRKRLRMGKPHQLCPYRCRHFEECFVEYPAD
jgi:hypothetical protein